MCVNIISKDIQSRFKKIILAVILLCTPFLGVASNNSSESLTPIKLQLNWNHQFEFAGFYAAIKQGYYKEVGLNVSIQDWSPELDVLDELLSGRVDFSMNCDFVLVDYLNGAPIKLVMSVFQNSPKVLLSHKPIIDIDELDGMSIMSGNSFQIESFLSRSGVQLQEHPAKGDLQYFVDKKVDLYNAFITNEPFRLKEKQVPFYTVNLEAFDGDGYEGMLVTTRNFSRNNPSVVQAFKLATIKGWEYALDNQEEMVDYIISRYPVVKSREALLFEAKTIVAFIRSGEVPIGHVEEDRLLAMAVDARASGWLSNKKLENLDVSGFVFDLNQVVFTPEELIYLNTNPVVMLANGNNRSPFEVYNEEGFNGIAAEYLQRITEKTGIKFKPQPHKRWKDVVKMASEGKLDMFAAAMSTPSRQVYMNFTEPYLSFPMVLVARNGQGFIKDYSQLTGYRVAVVKGFWSGEYLKKQYPGIIRVEFDSAKEGLNAVLDGRTDFYSGNLASIHYKINYFGLLGLDIVGQSGHSYEISMGMQRDNPVLFSIIEKSLAAISEEDRQEIYNNWLKIEFYHKVDTGRLWQIGLMTLVVLLILMSILFWCRQQRKRQEIYIKQIHELTYATLVDLEALRFLWVSDSYCRLTGYDKDELLSMSYLNMIPGKRLSDKRKAILKDIKKGGYWRGEVEGKTKQGDSYFVEITLSPEKYIAGEMKRCWATRVDITDKKRIEEFAIKDDLTGIYNRRYFNQVINQEINRAKREESPFLVAMLDLDHFKNINDAYGHQRGDEVLKKIASLLKQGFNRATDLVFRMGGEEFLVLSYFKSEVIFEEYLQSFCLEVESLNIENKGVPLGRLTISIGASFWHSHRLVGVNEVYREVDERLYQAKKQGRNQVVMSSKEVSKAKVV